jgi:hypothetical protein
LKAVEKTIYFEEDAVVILDQTKLPGQVVFEKIETIDQAAEAIKKLKVRGAPLIGVAAAFALAMAVKNTQDRNRYWKPIFGIGKTHWLPPGQRLSTSFGPWKEWKESTGKTVKNPWPNWEIPLKLKLKPCIKKILKPTKPWGTLDRNS